MIDKKFGDHYSVLKKEIMDFFSEQIRSSASNQVFADLTFGGGGHTFALWEKFPAAKIHAFDQDPEAIENGLKLIEEKGAQDGIRFYASNFCHFTDVLERDLFFDGVLLDAGVSSHQFDKSDRGFSFRFEGPLDMRMDFQKNTLTAKKILNEYSESELLRVIREYGEEKYASNIVKNILSRRCHGPLETTKDLEDLCFHSYPKKLRHGKIHPATKTFQALRIEVNQELNVLEDVINQVIPRLRIGGIFAVISFHSLEDRIVKNCFKNLNTADYPLEILTKKPVIPSEDEIFENSRSRSAKLRVVRRVEKLISKNKYSRS